MEPGTYPTDEGKNTAGGVFEIKSYKNIGLSEYSGLGM